MDDGRVHYRKHYLGYGAGCGQHPGAKPSYRDDCCTNIHVTSLDGGVGRRWFGILTMSGNSRESPLQVPVPLGRYRLACAVHVTHDGLSKTQAHNNENEQSPGGNQYRWRCEYIGHESVTEIGKSHSAAGV